MLKNLIIIFLIIPIYDFGQNYIQYYNFRNESIKAYYNGEFELADSLMLQGVKIEEPFGKDIYYLAVVNAKIGNGERVEHFLKYADSLNSISNGWLIKDKDLFLQVLDHVWFNEFTNKVYENNEIRYSNIQIDSMLFSKIENLIKRDQFYRSNLSKDHRFSNIELDSLMHLNDLKVQEELINIIEESGWPKGVNELVNTILIHFTPENYISYRELILGEVKKGNLDPFWYASMVDRLENLINEKPCYYGIWGNCEPSKSISERRKMIGLSVYWDGPFRLFTKVQLND